MHEFHGSYGAEPDAAPVSGPSAEPASPDTFPGTEPIDATAPLADTVSMPAPKGPSWAERRAAKRAAKGEPPVVASTRGGIPWDVRVKIAVVLSFVILVSVLIFNKVKGKARDGKAIPLASIAGSKGTEGADPVPVPAKPEGDRIEEPAASSPPEPEEVEPPPTDPPKVAPLSTEPAKPVSEPAKVVEPPPPVEAPPEVAPAEETKGALEVPPPSDLGEKVLESAAAPPMPVPVEEPKSEAPKTSPPTDSLPPIESIEKPVPVPEKEIEASPSPADEPPAKDPSPSPAPLVVDAPLPAEKLQPGPVEPRQIEPEAPSAPALPDLSTPPPTREVVAPSPSPAAGIAEGAGFAIPNAGMTRTSGGAKSGSAPEMGTIPGRVNPAPAPTPRAGGSSDGTIHVVRRGENFWTISRYHYASGRFYKALWDANRDVAKAPEDLYVGATIRIPAVEELNRDLIEAPKVAAGAGGRRPAEALPANAGPRDQSAERVSARPDTAVALPRANPAKRPLITRSPSSAPAYRIYVVKGGNETLRSVARDQLKDSEREDEIYRLNRDDFEEDSRRLRPGMALKIPNETSRR